MKRLVTPAFLVVVCLLGLAELGARIFFAHDITGRFAYGYDPEAGFSEQADGTVELYRAGGRRFHPQTFRKRRPPGTFRIFVVGDSVPRGPSFQAAYPWQLGQELREHHIRAESINLAVPGYGPRRAALRRGWVTTRGAKESLTSDPWNGRSCSSGSRRRCGP